MSTQGESEAPESEAPEPEKPVKPTTKIYYCEVCRIPCMSAIILQTHFAGLKHKKRERALKRKYAPVISEEPETVKRPLSKNIRSLKDFMKDPDREEPLVGLEYVLEIRFQGRRDPRYECQLCEFNTDIVPMIQHLVGQRHRKAYLIKHFPDKGKRNPNDEPKEDRARFLRRIAREVEKEEGLKMYKIESFERPSVPTSAERKRARWGCNTFKPENDPVLRQKALEYMDFFEVTSDAEATQVIRIAQSLSEALKDFCEKKAALQHIRSLPPLMPPGPRNIMQQKTKKPYESFDDDQEDMKLTQELTSSRLRKLQILFGQASSAPLTNPVKERTSRVSQSALGINEWMKQFNNPSASFQSNPDGEKSLGSTSSPTSYAAQYHQQSSTQKHDNRLADTGTRSWDSMKDPYSATRAYPASCPSKDFPSWYKDGNSSQMSVSHPAASNNLAWPQSSGYQQPNLQADGKAHQPPIYGGSLYNDYQQQNIMGQRSSGLSPNILSQLRGKDTATLTKMLQELIPHYPDLQKIDIYALAQALSKIS